MAEKFTDAQVDVMVGTYEANIGLDYEARTKVVEEIAKELGVPVGRVRGKLVAEGVYKKKETEAKASAINGMDKEAVAKAFEDSFGLKMPSIRNMSKKDLVAFWERFVEMSAIRDADNNLK